MTNYLTKLRYILLPFLLCIIALLLGYSFLNWLLIIQLEWITVDDIFIEIFAPAIIAFIIAITMLRSTVRRLYFKNDKGSDFFYFILTLGIGIPTIIAQMYLSTATGKLTALDNISQIDSLPKTKYYTLKQYYFYKNDVSTKEDIGTSGKNNQYMDFRLYCVVPILKTQQDTLAGTTHYWLCKKYIDEISNYSSEEVKRAAFDNFVRASEMKFKLESFSFSYLERISHGQDAKYFGHAASLNHWSRDGIDILLETQHGDFAERNGEKLGWVFKSTGIVLAIFALLLLCFRLKTTAELSKDNKKIAREKARGWRKNYEWILPHEGFYSTPLLLYANLLVFLAMVFSGMGLVSFNGSELIEWGSLYKPYLEIQGEWWRLVTYMFLHGGLMHILNNMVSLYFVSFFLEHILGKWRFVMVYLVSGICAGIASYYWHEHTNTVGASGAIFGLYGFMLALILMKVTSPGINKFFFIIASISIGYTLLMGIFGNVDNVAHIGGLVTGFLMGLVLSGDLKRDNPQEHS
ncbi:MAG: rhomboid family intramembrane serine protease [Flavobacterium sp.]|uniref:rhomboid family intramembrane serine protease n=1 Tax=Flavobacterium sp. TaxID=239 RepID=UPI003266F71C